MEDIRFDNLFEVLQQYGNDVANTYRQSLEDNGKRATGTLISSVSYGINVNGNEYEVYLNLADYWKYVENGRGPGKFPPPDKIREWIRVKPILPRPDKNGKLPTEQQLAYLIGRKIAKEGIKPKGILEGTLNILNEKYMPLIKEAIQKDLNGMAGDWLTVIQRLK